MWRTVCLCAPAWQEWQRAGCEQQGRPSGGCQHATQTMNAAPQLGFSPPPAPQFLSKLVNLQGIVTRCTLVRPKIVKSVHW